MATAKKILLIDDDSFFVSIISNAFGKKGFEVHAAADGKTGIEIARADQPDLILLDLTMSGTDGFAVLGSLKADDMTKKIPVVILSSLNETDDIARAKQGGAADYLVKMNFTPEQIIARIEQSLVT